jgi:hypothetical protein
MCYNINRVKKNNTKTKENISSWILNRRNGIGTQYLNLMMSIMMTIMMMVVVTTTASDLHNIFQNAFLSVRNQSQNIAT